MFCQQRTIWVCGVFMLLVACSGRGTSHADAAHADHGDAGQGDAGTNSVLPSSVPVNLITTAAVYVVNGGDNSISVIDPDQRTVVGTIQLIRAAFPHHISLSPDGSKLAVAVPGVDLSGGHGGGHGGHGTTPGAVIVLDATTGTTLVSRILDVSNHNAVFSADGTEVWTTQMSHDGTVLVLDAATLVTRQTIAVGMMPAEVSFSVNGAHAFVANGMSNTVSIIHAASKAVVQTVSVGANPVGAWPGLDGVMYVDNEAGRTLTAINATTFNVARTYDLAFTPGMAQTPTGGDRVWVTDGDTGRVVSKSASMDQTLGEVTTGSGAHGIAFSVDGSTAFVTNQNANSVSIIAVQTMTVLATVPVGSKPNGIVFRAHP